jgi:hypothetical protein
MFLVPPEMSSAIIRWSRQLTATLEIITVRLSAPFRVMISEVELYCIWAAYLLMSAEL